MKKQIFIAIILLFTNHFNAQEKTKDTLFFGTDRFYTVSPTLNPELLHQTYAELEETHKEQLKQTGTNGYIYFTGKVNPAIPLKSHKVLSIKDYIENRKFYFDGIHNKIIDKWKLEDSLTKKYKILFVNGGEIIESDVVNYSSYYPIGKGDDAIVNTVKDTLFFRLDTPYIQTFPEIPNHFYISDSKGSNGSFYFSKVKVYKNLKSKEVKSLQKFVRASRFYDKNKAAKLNDYRLWEYFNNYVVFLVNEKKKEFTEVTSGYEIE